MQIQEIEIPRYRKGDKLYCAICSDHIFTLSVDLFNGNSVNENIFVPNDGQNPKNGEPSRCKLCGYEFFGGGYFMGIWE